MATSNPRVSVIIPCYNREKYLGEAIESVLRQESAATLEVIVVDDGSTDDTSKVLASFGEKIRTVRIENSGRPAVPRNIGIGMAQGSLIAFQDSDDRWAADKLALQLPAFEDPNVMLAYGNAATMDQAGRVSETKVVPDGDMKSGDIFDDLLDNNFISTLTVMVRREALDRGGIFNEAMALRGIEDYQLWLRLALLGKVVAVPQVLAYYRQHDQNISDVPQAQAYQRQIDTFRSLPHSGLAQRQQSHLHTRLAGLYGARSGVEGGGGWRDSLIGGGHRVAAKCHKIISLIGKP